MIDCRSLGMEGLFELRPARHGDERGFFSQVWSRAEMQASGLDFDFVQDNHSHSARKGVLRGLHYQRPPAAQAKLIRVTRGAVFDAVVDLRAESATFGQWAGLTLSAVLWNQLLVPAGFAHGFLTLEDDVEVQYKVTTPYRPDLEGLIRYDDPALAIDWPIERLELLLSERDRTAPLLADADLPTRW
jgi:dTDP-4-dehydrorhamnose 3,5-epimerase